MRACNARSRYFGSFLVPQYAPHTCRSPIPTFEVQNCHLPDAQVPAHVLLPTPIRPARSATRPVVLLTPTCAWWRPFQQSPSPELQTLTYLLHTC